MAETLSTTFGDTPVPNSNIPGMDYLSSPEYGSIRHIKLVNAGVKQYHTQFGGHPTTDHMHKLKRHAKVAEVYKIMKENGGKLNDAQQQAIKGGNTIESANASSTLTPAPSGTPAGGAPGAIPAPVNNAKAKEGGYGFCPKCGADSPEGSLRTRCANNCETTCGSCKEKTPSADWKMEKLNNCGCDKINGLCVALPEEKIANKATFRLPKDGFVHLVSLGNHEHNTSGLVQVIDKKAIDSMVKNFNELKKKNPDHAIIIDRDHLSQLPNGTTAAAGWITNLEARNDGLYGKPAWSDDGEKEVRNGVFRYFSPVWLKKNMESVEPGTNLMRPLQIEEAALTNNPNLSGLKAISSITNRAA